MNKNSKIKNKQNLLVNWLTLRNAAYSGGVEMFDAAVGNFCS